MYLNHILYFCRKSKAEKINSSSGVCCCIQYTRNKSKKNFISQSAWTPKIPVIAAPWSNLLDYNKSSPLRSWYCKDTATCCKTENIIKSSYQECSVAFCQAWPTWIMPLGLGTILALIPQAFYLAQASLWLQQIKLGLCLEALTSSEETKCKAMLK